MKINKNVSFILTYFGLQFDKNNNLKKRILTVFPVV